MTLIDSSLELDEDIVAEYLSNNKDFFSRYPELLHFLELPHDSGTATSLVERQVAILRERNIDARKRLTLLMETASENDRLFKKTRNLTLSLMDAQTPADLDTVLVERLVVGFDADHAIVYLLGSGIASQPHIVDLRRDEELPVARLFSQPSAACGTYRPTEYARLFNHSLASPGSAALVPMRLAARPKALNATLAIGSTDPHRFSREMGTIFLEFIGDVLGRTLLRLLRVA